MERNPVKNLPYIFFTGFILLQVFLILFGKDNFETWGFDNIRHYQIAKFSFNHPELFFDTWGKPLYTVLVSPFALLSYNIAKSFNLIVSVLIMWLSAKIATRVFAHTPLFTVVLIAFSPAYFFLSTSCLPELLFALLLVAGIYFFLEEKLYTSAVIISFISFIRIEGFLIVGIFAIAFFLVKSHRSILFLLTGTIVYSLAGFIILGDFLWFTDKLPFPSSAIEGTNFYTQKNEIGFIFGFPLFILLIAGLVIWVFEKDRKLQHSKSSPIVFLMIAGSFLSVLIFSQWIDEKDESYFLLAAVVPLAAIIGGKTIDFISKKIKNNKVAQGIFVTVVIIQATLLFALNSFSFKSDPQEILLKKGTNYIRFNEPESRIFYFNPFVTFYLGIDPYDTLRSSLLTKNEQISDRMNWDDLVVWDSAFGAGKYGVVLKSLETDSNLEKLESFYLHDKTVEFRDDDLSVQIFKKTKEKRTEFVVSDSYTRTLSFENYIDPRVKEVNGIKFWELDSAQEYSPNIELTTDLIELKETLEFTVKLKYKAFQPLLKSQVLLVFSVIDNGKSIYYEGVNLGYKGNEKEEVELNPKIPATLPVTSKIRIYVWNKERKNLLIESIKVDAKSY